MLFIGNYLLLFYNAILLISCMPLHNNNATNSSLTGPSLERGRIIIHDDTYPVDVELTLFQSEPSDQVAIGSLFNSLFSLIDDRMAGGVRNPNVDTEVETIWSGPDRGYYTEFWRDEEADAHLFRSAVLKSVLETTQTWMRENHFWRQTTVTVYTNRPEIEREVLGYVRFWFEAHGSEGRMLGNSTDPILRSKATSIETY